MSMPTPGRPRDTQGTSVTLAADVAAHGCRKARGPGLANAASSNQRPGADGHRARLVAGRRDLHLVCRRGRQLGLAELPRVQCLGRHHRPLRHRCAAGRLPDLFQSDRLFPGLLSAPSAAAALRPDDRRRGARPQSAADLFSDPRPAAGSGDGDRDRGSDPDCRGRADDAFGSGHELLRHPHRASDCRGLHPDPVGGGCVMDATSSPGC